VTNESCYTHQLCAEMSTHERMTFGSLENFASYHTLEPYDEGQMNYVTHTDFVLKGVHMNKWTCDE